MVVDELVAQLCNFLAHRRQKWSWLERPSKACGAEFSAAVLPRSGFGGKKAFAMRLSYSRRLRLRLKLDCDQAGVGFNWRPFRPSG
jgi:hypothetical protein